MATVAFLSYPSQSFDVQYFEASTGSPSGAESAVVDTGSPGKFAFEIAGDTGIYYVVAESADYTLLGYVNLSLPNALSECELRDTYDEAVGVQSACEAAIVAQQVDRAGAYRARAV